MIRVHQWLSLAAIVSAFQFSTSAVANSSLSVPTTDGSLNFVVCPLENQVRVFDTRLQSILFSAEKGKPVKYVQSFGTDSQEKIINGVSRNFVRVQFPDRPASQNQGWMEEDAVRLKSQCSEPEASMFATEVASLWKFPTLKRALQSYKTGMRRFGASRDGGARVHAAADIYRNDGEAVVAVNSGTVIRDKYYFYLGTYALEVKHTGGKIVRYGEIKSKKAAGISLGSTISSGQTVGYVGTVNSGCCSPMLHFEMYAGTATGALTQNGNKYQRRKDLIDPTASLTDWEKSQFGISF